MKVGVVDSTGVIVARESVAVDPRASFRVTMDSIVTCLEGTLRATGRQLAGIGVGTPGFTDKDSGVLVEGCRNIPNLQGNSIKSHLEGVFRVPTVVDNDATSAAAGELLFGVGRKYRDFVLITLGTGVGGGLVLDGRVYRGARGFAGEIGHTCVDPNGLWCNCGSRGCLEQYASATAIIRLYREKSMKRGGTPPETMTARQVFDAAAAGDTCAADAIEGAAEKIAQSFGTLLNTLNLEACVIGGGVSQAGEAIVAPVRRHLPDYAWPLLAGADIVLAELGNDAGILGAAAGVLDRLGPVAGER